MAMFNVGELQDWLAGMPRERPVRVYLDRNGVTGKEIQLTDVAVDYDPDEPDNEDLKVVALRVWEK